MAYYADFKYNNPRNADLIYFMDNIGRLRQYQVADTLIADFDTYGETLQNAIRELRMCYTNLIDRIEKRLIKELKLKNTDYGEYVLEIQNRFSHVKTHLLTPVQLDFYNRIALNFTTRMSITYNWDRYFINANGQFNNFNYKHNALHGHLNDWFINASVGVRL